MAELTWLFAAIDGIGIFSRPFAWFSRPLDVRMSIRSSEMAEVFLRRDRIEKSEQRIDAGVCLDPRRWNCQRASLPANIPGVKAQHVYVARRTGAESP